MNWIIAAATAGVVLAMAGPAAAETWNVTEGKQGDTRGVWQVTTSGATITGNAHMFAPKGRAVNYHLAGEIKDGQLVLHRVEPSDRVSCTYVVDETRAAAFAGSAICDGVSYPWRVTRKPN